jgi:hypothetical protein
MPIDQNAVEALHERRKRIEDYYLPLKDGLESGDIEHTQENIDKLAEHRRELDKISDEMLFLRGVR